jgi:hypothetical protein
MRLKAVFLGFANREMDRVVDCIEAASPVEIEAASSGDTGPGLELSVDTSDVVFVSRAVGDRKLESLLRKIRQVKGETPIVLTYGEEADGKAFLFARRFDCLLFSPADRLNVTLTPAEVGQALQEAALGTRVDQRLMEISMCTGPCSTGE